MVMIMIKIIKNKRTQFFKRKIRELTIKLHFYEYDEFGDKPNIYNKRFIYPQDKNAYLIFYNNKVIGVISIKRTINNIYIWRFFIEPQYRNSNIGTYVMKFIQSNFKFDNIYLRCLKENTIANNFYVKNCFVRYKNDNVENYYKWLGD